MATGAPRVLFSQGIPLCTPETPGSPVLVSGEATCFYDAVGGVTDITLDEPSIIHWENFAVRNGEQLRFTFNGVPNPAVLNRVTGRFPTRINGSLVSNGRVLVVNPNSSIQVGPSGFIDADGGFFASTLDVDAADEPALLTGGGATLALSRGTTGILQIDGTVRSEGGDIVLVGRSVVAGGTLDAPAGAVRIAAGTSVTYSGTTAAPDEEAFEANASSQPSPLVSSGLVTAQGVELNAFDIRVAGRIETPQGNGQVFFRVGNGTTVIEDRAAVNAIIVNDGIVQTEDANLIPGNEFPTGTTSSVSRFPSLRAPGSAARSRSTVAFSNAAIVGLSNSARGKEVSPKEDEIKKRRLAAQRTTPKPVEPKTRRTSTTSKPVVLRKQSFFGMRGSARGR